MRIAQIAPVIERVPPKKYGGTERVVSALTEELVRRGHDVTLFASGDSITSAKLFSVYPRALREAKIKDMYGFNAYTILNIGLAYDHQKEFDIIHDHTGHSSLPTANLATTPTLFTMHGPFTSENRPIFQRLKKPGIVTISESQARYAPHINHLGTVYNGLPMDDYPYSATPGKYLLFVGRICLEKGVHYAIETALALDLPLIIAAKLEPIDRSYYQEHVEPYLSDNIQWIGEVNEEERNKLMSEALCFLHPVTWAEPFGLTMIEAMACGTPVVAFAKGSIPEIVAHGKTGFVAMDVDEMIEAVGNIQSIKREDCRTYALEKFSATKMTDGYEAIYKKLLSK